jgi:hopanoid C-2 methylase
MKNLPKRQIKKRVLIINCFFDELRIPVGRRLKVPQSMAPAFLAGVFSSSLCDIKLYNEAYSGPLEDERILAFPNMLVLTGLNSAFDRMLHITAYVKSKNKDAVVVAGGPAIRALPEYSKRFFDYCCIGDIEQLAEVVESVFGKAYVSETFLEKGWVVPRFDLAYWTKILFYIESSRNCYFKCNFCSLTAENGRYRPYELEYVRQQFNALGKRRFVHFIDNNFATYDKEFSLERFRLLKQLFEKKYISRWAAEVTSDFFHDDENLELAAQSGCGGLFCGVESFDVKTLSSFRKNQNTVFPQIDLIRKCLHADIPFHYGIIFDLTTRSIDELRAEMEFILDTPEIPLPGFISLAIPLLKTPFFYECLNEKLFLPDIRLRDLDGSTITLKPQDSLPNAVRFVRQIQNLIGYRTKVVRHMKDFFNIYKDILSLENRILEQYNAFLLCTPNMSTVGFGIVRILLDGQKNKRTFVGTTEPLDSVYHPAFQVDSRYRHYFKPTMLTDENGDLCEALAPDFMRDRPAKYDPDNYIDPGQKGDVNDNS